MFRPAMAAMRSCGILGCSLSLALALLAPAVSASAQESVSSPEAIGRLLGELWNRTGEEQPQSKMLGESALRRDSTNQDLAYAYALNRMQHYRYADAARILKPLAQARPARIDALQLLSWAELVTGQHDQSLATLRELNRQIRQQAGVPESVRSGFHRHAGRIMGFLQGPASAHVNADLLQASLTAIADGAEPAMLDLFNAERNAVLEKYEQISKSEAAAADAFLKEAAAKSAVEAANLQNANQTLAQRRDLVQPEVSRLKAEGATRLSALDQQAAPLLVEATAIDASANQLAWTLNQVHGEIYLNQQLLLEEEDFWLRNSLQLRLNQLYGLARQYQLDLSQARSRLVGLQSQLNVLGVQRSQLEVGYSSAIGQTQVELNQLDSAQRRNEKKLEKIADGPGRVTGEALVLANKKDLLSTYYLLSLELYRERFLASQPQAN